MPDIKVEPVITHSLAVGPGFRITVGNLGFAQFQADDTEDLYQIRNDESVRKFMTDPRPIAYDAHEQWVQRNLVPGGALLR